MIVSGSSRHLRHTVLALAVLLVGGVVIRITACRAPEDAPLQPVAQTEAGDAEQAIAPPEDLPHEPDTFAAENPAQAEPPAPASGPLQVMIYYPAATSSGLIGEPHEIFRTSTPGDRAKQIIADLISGPMSDQALRVIPSGSRLRQVYVLDSVAWVDFSSDLKSGMAGGSHEELLTVYSIVDSIALNITEIQKVGILINGQPVETLTGHVDLRRPLRPMRSLIDGTVTAGLGQDRPADSRRWTPA